MPALRLFGSVDHRERRQRVLVAAVAVVWVSLLTSPASAATGTISSPCVASIANSAAGSTLTGATYDFADVCEWVQGHQLYYFNGSANVVATTYGTHPTAHQIQRTGYLLYWSYHRVKEGWIGGKQLNY